MSNYTQFYSLHTIKNRQFRGDVKLSELVLHGDFGIGTFNDIDGELVAVGGKIYRTQADGSAELVSDLDEKTPYAIMTEFEPHVERTIARAGLSDIEATVDAIRSTMPETILSIEVSGRFQWVRTRAPHPSYPPYKDLAEIIADQPSTTFNDLSGDIVGFYTPEFLSALGVPGYHLHFIDADRQCGGHLQDAYIEDGVIRIQCIDEVKVVKPGG